MVFDRLADKSDPPRCVVCLGGLALDAVSTPARIGWLKPISRDDLYVFALCYSCATDDSEDFHERFLTAIAGKGARTSPPGQLEASRKDEPGQARASHPHLCGMALPMSR
jgi:hypothetical protein